MALYTVTFGQVSSPTDLNQVVNVLQQPSGGQEKGKYWLAGGSYAVNAVISTYMPSLSRNTVPVSVSADTADFSPTSCNAPTTDHLSANGFHVWTNSTAITTNNLNVAGNWTIQY